MVVRSLYRVIYGDTDQMGFVYYANYYRLFEMGRNEYLRERGLTYREIEEKGLRLPVTESKCKYRSPAYYDDLLTVETRITKARGARIRFFYEIKNEEGKLLASGETEHANVDESGKVCRLEPELIEILAPEG